MAPSFSCFQKEDFQEWLGYGTELRSRPKEPNRKPFARLPIWKGGATKRYKVFGDSPQTDAENVVSAVCSDAVVPRSNPNPNLYSLVFLRLSGR